MSPLLAFSLNKNVGRGLVFTVLGRSRTLLLRVVLFC
jgi:hypothetical protein